MKEVSLIAFSAGFVGFVHSLGPAHWIPVLLIAKSRKWSISRALLGAWVTGLGHILATLLVSLALYRVEKAILHDYEESVERFSGLFMAIFGIGLAANALWRHRRCHGHSHHGPSPRQKESRPMSFLFILGVTPCMAVLPSFVSLGAVAGGIWLPFLWVSLCFSVGVWLSLFISTSLVMRGLMKLDHPILEHFGDVVAGLGIALVGALLLFMGHSHDFH